MSRKLTILFVTILLHGLCAYGATPVETHGQLHVDSNKIVDQHGNPVQLRGMSMFWSQWGSSYYKKTTVDWLVQDWKISVIRAAMAVENGGYLSTPESQEKLVDTIVQAAIANGIYVIIDWHDHNAHLHTDSAKLFFESMAQKYGNHPNIIYEIYNEPEQITWNTVKAYADTIIKAIRAIDDSNLVVVGTPNWCQYVTHAANDPITGYANIAYSLHFYAATHKQWLRNNAKTALSKGIPLFVTEFGLCLASGNGTIDLSETRAWMQFLNENKLSWCNWTVNSKMETSSALKTTAFPTGNWKTDDLRQSGLILRTLLRGDAETDNIDSGFFYRAHDTLSLLGRIEVEKYAIGAIARKEITDDSSGTEHIVLDKDNWITCLTKKLMVKTRCSAQIRVSGNTTPGNLYIYLGDVRFGTVKLPVASEPQSWITLPAISATTIDTGKHMVRLVYTSDSSKSSIKVNWIDFVQENSVIRSQHLPASGVRFTKIGHGITISLPDNHGIQQLEITTINGTIIKRKDIVPTLQSVHIDDLPNGYYIFRLYGKGTLTNPVIINN